jgi:phospholipase/lecithinase/hemolysin
MGKGHASNKFGNVPTANAECQPANVHPTQKIHSYISDPLFSTTTNTQSKMTPPNGRPHRASARNTSRRKKSGKRNTMTTHPMIAGAMKARKR